jgi:hypothetical protein
MHNQAKNLKHIMANVIKMIYAMLLTGLMIENLSNKIQAIKLNSLVKKIAKRILPNIW